LGCQSSFIRFICHLLILSTFGRENYWSAEGLPRSAAACFVRRLGRFPSNNTCLPSLLQSSRSVLSRVFFLMSHEGNLPLPGIISSSTCTAHSSGRPENTPVLELQQTNKLSRGDICGGIFVVRPNHLPFFPWPILSWSYQQTVPDGH